MKFKTIYFFFNAILVVSFTVIFFMPFFMLGWDYVKVFWTQNWYLPLVFFLTVAVLNAYFLSKWKLFSLLESENWKEASQYLERRIYEKNSSSRQAVRILINTCIVLADIVALARLSRHIAENKPRLFAVFALDLGVPYIIRGDPAMMEAYFEKALRNPRVRKRDWLRWNLAFARMAGGGYADREKVREELSLLAKKEEDPLLVLLSVYLLDKSAEKGDDEARLIAGVCSSLKGKYTREAWVKTVGRSRNTLMGLVLSKLADEAEKWLFEGEE
ncbi:MAG: hypothetical protein LBT33_03545 [Spirochaetia bacterium]|nr:hypothetical protein [Spirochaetia bacterium]